MRLDKVENAVDSINYDLYELCEKLNLKDYYNYDLSIEYSGIVIVKFLGIIIWDDDNDEREWIESNNDYEDLENFLRKKIHSVLENITKIKTQMKGRAKCHKQR